jgi:hypothetical protein
MHRIVRLFLLPVAASVLPLAAGVSIASAQFGPPSTVVGSIADAAGPVAAGVPVEAYVGTTLCGKGATEFTGEGAARVTVYAVDVVSREQTAGCGSDNAEVRIKVGDRFAAQTAKWRAGLVQVDITFGNATPAPIPTFTPTPVRTPTPRLDSSGTPLPPATGGTAVGRVGTPNAPASASPGTATPGGVTSSSPGPAQTQQADAGSFPIWAAVVIVLGLLSVIAGAVGYIMSRHDSADSDDDPYVPGPPGGA